VPEGQPKNSAERPNTVNKRGDACRVIEHSSVKERVMAEESFFQVPDKPDAMARVRGYYADDFGVKVAQEGPGIGSADGKIDQ